MFAGFVVCGRSLALETATALGGIANGIATVVFPWLVLERTGSPSAAAAVGALTLLPLLVTSFVSGTIVDLVGRRAVSVASDLLSLVSVAAVPLLDAAIGLGVGWLAALAVLGATFDPAGITAREAMLPDAAGASGSRWSARTASTRRRGGSRSSSARASPVF